MNQVVFLLMFPPPEKAQRSALGCGAQRAEMAGFLRIAAGDHATGHRA